jgi:hypothetical protein
VKNRVSLLALFSLCIIPVSQPARCQESAHPAAQQNVQAQPVQTSFTSSKGFVLEEETPVRLRLNRTISSADAHVGDTVDFEVLDDISVNGTLVIAKGGLAFATVTEAKAKRRMARGGKLDINIDYVKLASGEKAALRAVRDVKGGGHTGGMVGGMVATSLLFFPAAPFFLFMHGKDVSIPKGTEITAYVNGDMKLDIAKFQPATVSAAAQATTGNGVGQGGPPLGPNAHIESVPPGADIEVDGSFVGSTPSDLEIGDGEHMILVRKTGFKEWNRKLRINGASKVRLTAELEIVATPSASISAGEGNAAKLVSQVNQTSNGSLTVAKVHDESNVPQRSTIGAFADGNPEIRHDGVTLTAVTPGGPADQAGIKAGDVILAINDHYLFTIRDLQEEISHHEPGTKFTVRYRRYSAINEASVVVGRVQ